MIKRYESISGVFPGSFKLNIFFDNENAGMFLFLSLHRILDSALNIFHRFNKSQVCLYMCIHTLCEKGLNNHLDLHAE